MAAVSYYPFDHQHDLDETELKALLGGKGAGLAVMTGLGIPVPPGFTIPTDVCRQYLETGWSDEMEQAVREGIAGIEASVGRRLGDPALPLLVSVRSGAAVSMPGMMDTVLDVGMSSEAARGLAELTGDDTFAWDTLRRHISSFCHVVGEADEGMKKLAERADDADSIEASLLPLVEEIRRLGEAGSPVSHDPYEQVLAAVEAVFRSWKSPRAIAYREREGIDPDMGTAATVQAMVFGNLGKGSGTGVAFSRDPSSGEPGLMGDFLIGAQGDDVVAGTHETMHLDEMATMWPDVWSELQAVASTLEHHTGDAVDLEFTVEEGRLWLLQSRAAKRSPLAVFRIAVAMANDETFPVDRAEAVRRCEPYLEHPPEILDGDPGDGVDPDDVLATGLAASPGRAIGVVSLDPDDAVEREQNGEQVVLVREETSPADVHGMAASVGIVTTLGGLVSHAAVVARSWGLAAIVGAKGIEIREDALMCGDRRVEPGETVTVDGDNGRLLLGEHQIGSRVPPEVEIVRVWARSLETAEGAGGEGTADATIDDCLRVIGLKGMGSSESIAEALDANPDHVAKLLEQLESDELVSPFAGGRFRAMPPALERMAELFEAEREGRETEFDAVLDRFHEPNMALKEIVTAWQMRTVDGAEVPNDHSDEAYDAGVIQRLKDEVHSGVGPLLDDVEALLPRLGRYAGRLETALERLDGGDERYVAHPMLDSYHTVWFELHEELIHLSGRDRKSEAQAGRA
jgi:pyruvate,orthophosphate dikinase